MECIKNKYVYKGKDISFLVVKKIEEVVFLLAKKTNTSFEDAYSDFLKSQMYKVLQNTASVMWSESAEFIVQEYLNPK